MKKIFNTKTNLILLFLLSCTNTIDNVKKGLGGGKRKVTDEFLVKKKDSLTLPPKWDTLPTPGETLILDDDIEKASDIERLIKQGSGQKSSTNFEKSANVEESFLKKIKNK